MSHQSRPVRRRGKIVLLHFVGQMPLAGIAWQAAHHIAGLEKLGYETWYVEDHGINPYDPRVNSVVMDCDYNVAFLRNAMERYGLAGRWAYWDAIRDVYHGLPRERVHALYAEADALINLCAATRLREEHLRCPVRIMVDTDPVYEQIRIAKGDPAVRIYTDVHTHFFTYGENLGTPACDIPLKGVAWRPTRPPVATQFWPAQDSEPQCFSTIATWENKGKNIDFEGNTYLWSKHRNFLKFLDLPRYRPDTCFRLAIAPPDGTVRAEVEGQGWQIVDPMAVSTDIDTYRDFIAGSRGEFTVAKDIYARPNSGWFSDRGVCYLASGRPVVTMRTGFARHIPVGRGLFDFATHDEAVAAIDAIASDYPGHSRAARAIAEEYFAAERVVGQMLDQCGV